MFILVNVELGRGNILEGRGIINIFWNGLQTVGAKLFILLE